MTAGFAAVAWDVDGTLVDSEPLHHRALVAVSASYGVDLGDLTVDDFRGVAIDDVWTALRPRFPVGTQREAWLQGIIDHYVLRRAELVALPGAVETVRALARRGVPQVCVSNSNRPIVDANLDALGIADVMRATISLDDVSQGKPAPEPYAKAASVLGIGPARIVGIEDSRSGAASAKAAGLHVVACGPEAAEIRDADRVVSDLREILVLFGHGSS